MNEYKRLTEKDTDGMYSVFDDEFKHPFENVQNAIDRLGEFEDKIEQGLLVELPCKVGDKIYYLFQYSNERILPFVREAKVRKIYCANKKNQFLIDCECPALKKECVLRTWYFNDFGKTIFLTKPEAEAKLAELRGVE